MSNHETHQEAGDITPASCHSGTPDRADPPVFELTIWPHRSMPRFGFRRVLLFAAGMFCIPLVPLLGTPVGWALLPFIVGTLGLLWFFIERNYRDGTLHENLRIWPDLITVDRIDPRHPSQHWQANPYWVATHIYPEGRVENYLTLKGNGREIELGAFLSPDERLDLRRDIDAALRDIRTAQH